LNQSNNSVLVTLSPAKDVPNPPEIRKVPCHKKNSAVGDKDVFYGNQFWIEQEDARTFKQDEEVSPKTSVANKITLMDWGNAIIRSIECEVDGTVTAINADLHLAGDFKKTEKKITWVANVKESLTPCILTTFDHLITKDKLEEGDDITDYVNHDSVAHVEATGDLSMKTLPVGSIIQFERKGYFRLDRAYDPVTSTAGEFFLIPDGKTVTRYGAKA
jgi:glutamyl-tRNA synthetase